MFHMHIFINASHQQYTFENAIKSEQRYNS